MATSHITQFIQSLNFEEIKIVKEYVYKSNTSKDNMNLQQKSGQKVKRHF